MKRVTTGAMVALALTASFFTTAAPAEAYTKTVYVDAPTTIRTRWGITSEVKRIDYYTGSRMVYGKCRTGYKCVVIRQTSRTKCGTVNIAGCAYTYSNGNVLVQLNPNLRNYSGWYAATTRHELGHAFGIWTHNRYGCRYAMYKNVACNNGKAAGINFTTAERRTLARN